MRSQRERGVRMGNDLNDSLQESVQTFDVELQNGIFNLVLTWCNQKANTMPMNQAKTEVADFLQKLIDGLLFEDKTEKGNKKE